VRNGEKVHNAIVTNDNPAPPDAQPPSWTRRIILIFVVSGVLAILAALASPTIGKPLGLAAGNLSRFWAAIIVATTFSIICFLVYFVAKKSLWEFLDLLIVPLALAIIGFGFTFIQDNRQQKIEDQRTESAIKIEEQRAQNAALQAYLDQMNDLILDRKLLKVNKGVPVHERGDPVHTLAQARTTTAITQFDGENNQAVTRFLSDSGLLKEPALLANTDLEGAQLPNAVLQNANLAGTNLTGANLTEAVLSSADFSAKEKEGEDTILITADLTRADLTKAALQEAKLAECTLYKVTLTKAALQGAVLNNASLKDANLSYAALQKAHLNSASLKDANLSHAALQNADLSSAESIANLQDPPLWFLKKQATNLTDVNLSHANLEDADLSSAYLSGADLTDANLTDADLSEAKGWTMEQLTAARSLEGATMPDGQTLKSDKMPHRPTFEDWLKDKEGRGENREKRGSS
jgi:uncharacterized protein YjbI with pentapeptide repeats